MLDRPLLYRARWVLPVTAKPIHDGELLVGTDGRIAAVAPAGALEVGESTEIRDLGAAALLPGLVNVHAHPELAMFRGGLEDLLFRDWILKLVGTKRSILRDEDSEAAAEWTMAECLSAGITTIAATEMSGAGARAMSRAGMRGIQFQEVFGPDPAQVRASISEAEEAVGRLRDGVSDLVTVGISPHAPYTVSDDLYRRTADLAARLDLRIAVHIAESEAERQLVTVGEGDFAPGLRARGIQVDPRSGSPIELLETTGILEQAPLLIHCVDVDAADIHRIAGHGAAVAHCPVANARLGHGFAPVDAMLDAGITVGLGTDSVGSNNRIDLLEEARIASIVHRGRLRSPDAFPAEQLLRWCTLEGARALGMDDRIGSLEPGKDADLCAVRMDDVHTIPVLDPVTSLFHSARGSDVVLSVVRGRELYDAGRFATLDLAGIHDRVEAAADRIREAEAR